MPVKDNPIMETIHQLLAPNGCPWDKKQTPKSLCEYLIEECFELVEAIRFKGPKSVKEELGDVFFLLYFLTALFERAGEFDLDQVLKDNAAKMRRRHPHVFADKDFKTLEEQQQAWEEIKHLEQDRGERGLFDSLPASLPPLTKAYRLHSKAAQAGFTWSSNQKLEGHLQDEWQEWEQAKADGSPGQQVEEFGDLLLTLVELGRRKGIKANAALDQANQKFLLRFRAMEELAAVRGQRLSSLDLEDQNALWEEVKARQGLD
jgi:ATP diphosphatase